MKAAATPKTTTTKAVKATKLVEKPEPKFEDELMGVAEQLIIKGKEQGYLTPDDILQGFPEIDAEPDQIFRIFAAFKEIGIEVTDGEKDFEEVEQIDDEMLLDIEMMDSVSLALGRRAAARGDRAAGHCQAERPARSHRAGAAGPPGYGQAAQPHRRGFRGAPAYLKRRAPARSGRGARVLSDRPLPADGAIRAGI
ncbi:MAG: hypothetical protein AUI15_03420 [Actinobacteria bacterium 13_2_20CM_2_66_6]|nr:MAG: hypothetical protein AUI15_03420 [Actinobacteria bacterium 13_2_20CM_2_66_6]